MPGQKHMDVHLQAHCAYLQTCMQIADICSCSPKHVSMCMQSTQIMMLLAQAHALVCEHICYVRRLKCFEVVTRSFSVRSDAQGQQGAGEGAAPSHAHASQPSFVEECMGVASEEYAAGMAAHRASMGHMSRGAGRLIR